MRGTELLGHMDLIDSEYVAAADRMPVKRLRIPTGWIATAACLALLILGTRMGYTPVQPVTPTLPTETSQSTQNTIPPESQGITPVDPDWTPYYNEYADAQIVSDGKLYAPCYFVEPLSPEELKALTPEIRPTWMQLSGYSEFLGYAGMEGDPELFGICLRITSNLPDAEISLTIRKYDYVDCIITGFEPVVSTLDGVDYVLYQWQTVDGLTHLKAEALRDGYTWRYILSIPTEQAEQGKDVLEKVIRTFVSVPYFAHITPQYIPEYIDQKLTLEDALAEPNFGSYFLRSVPKGFFAENIRRFKDYQSDLLYGLWCRGYDDLYWRVSRITDADQVRIISVKETEKYDLSLYPIPRAESVPEELWEIVNEPIFLAEELTLEAVMTRAYRIDDAGDSDGWRMEFRVLYGDILVEVRTKGVDPEWIYHQLTALKNQ